jgi:hypothetical protein
MDSSPNCPQNNPCRSFEGVLSQTAFEHSAYLVAVNGLYSAQPIMYAMIMNNKYFDIIL